VSSYEKFDALTIEKKKMIINAAMKEFIRGGYEKASMNRLVESAGISKGALFYYFGNKKNLYLFLFTKCEQMVLDTATSGIYEEDRDFISRLTRNISGNVALLEEYPLAYRFLKSCKKETAKVVADDIHRLKHKAADAAFAKLYHNIDNSLFKADIDVDMAIYAIKSTMFQIVHEYLGTEKNESKEVLGRIHKCADFFRMTLYK